MALSTIGTDTGGSIGIPAAACGIVGLKPSFGEVSVDGVVPLSRTFDHVGPLARTVTDACLVYHALLGDVGAPVPAPRPVTGLRLAVPRKYFCDILDNDVRARFEDALERLGGGRSFRHRHQTSRRCICIFLWPMPRPIMRPRSTRCPSATRNRCGCGWR
jgi:Asp-tRNA(Asn)/Glu-tRNA(Gln) amidotransferase A subunit family amidase